MPHRSGPAPPLPPAPPGQAVAPAQAGPARGIPSRSGLAFPIARRRRRGTPTVRSWRSLLPRLWSSPSAPASGVPRSRTSWRTWPTSNWDVAFRRVGRTRLARAFRDARDDRVIAVSRVTAAAVASAGSPAGRSAPNHAGQARSDRHRPAIHRSRGSRRGSWIRSASPYGTVLEVSFGVPYAFQAPNGQPLEAGVKAQPPSSSGLGRRPFKAVARVRIPLGVRASPSASVGRGACTARPRSAVG